MARLLTVPLARLLTFPVARLRFAVLPCGDRHLVVGLVTVVAVVAWRSVVAGCVAATRELEAYLKESMAEGL